MLFYYHLHRGIRHTVVLLLSPASRYNTFPDITLTLLRIKPLTRTSVDTDLSLFNDSFHNVRKSIYILQICIQRYKKVDISKWLPKLGFLLFGLPYTDTHIMENIHWLLTKTAADR